MVSLIKIIKENEKIINDDIKIIQDSNIREKLTKKPEYLTKLVKCLETYIREHEKVKIKKLVKEFGVDDLCCELIKLLCYQNIQEIDDLNDDIKNGKKFVWRQNQIDAIDKTIKQGYKSGIHNQFMGSGKTAILLNLIWKHFKSTKKIKTYIILCDKQEVLNKIFNHKVGDDHILDNKTIKYFKNADIIDLNEFNIIDCVNNKSDLVDFTANLDKPKLFLINNAFLRSKFQTDNCIGLTSDNVKFIMLDECHSITGTQFYKVLYDIKYKLKISIIGFSATPLRPRGEKQLRNIFCANNDEKQDEKDRLVNIISVYNLLYALKDDIVLPYKFHLLKLEKEHKRNDKLVAKMIFGKFDEVRKTLPYNKIICWAYTIKSMKYWANKIIKRYGDEYEIYISSSKDAEFIDKKDCNGDYYNCKTEEFFKLDKYAILIAVNRFREGSDIPNIDCAIYLDPIQKRSTLVSMQTSGRIIRHGKDDKKTHGTIIDMVVTTDNKPMDILTVRKIIEYGREILNLSTPSELTDKEERECDYEKIKDLEEKITINEGENKIIVRVDDNKKHDTEFIINDVEIDWVNLKQSLNDKIASEYKIDLEKRFSHNIEYLKKKYKFHEKNIDYDKKYKELLEKDDNLEKKFLKKEFKEVWERYNWYSALGIFDNYYHKSDEWIDALITNKNIDINKLDNTYYIKCLRYDNKLPLMHQEYYKDIDFCNIWEHVRNKKKEMIKKMKENQRRKISKFV